METDDEETPPEWDHGEREPPWVDDLRILARREILRLGAQMVAREFSAIPFVERVVLIGSVAALPERERSRRRGRRADGPTWHEPKDVDLAVWLSAFDNLNELRRARGRGTAQLFESTGLGVAHHQVEVFLFDVRSNEFRGALCTFAQCPKGKRECDVAGCGESPFLRRYEHFEFRPSALAPERSLLIFDRRLQSP